MLFCYICYNSNDASRREEIRDRSLNYHDECRTGFLCSNLQRGKGFFLVERGLVCRDSLVLRENLVR